MPGNPGVQGGVGDVGDDGEEGDDGEYVSTVNSRPSVYRASRGQYARYIELHGKSNTR